MRRRAFTLVELSCVIAIIVAIPVALYLGVFPEAFDQEKKLDNPQKGFQKWMDDTATIAPKVHDKHKPTKHTANPG